jgi:hypothetical protein
MTAKNLQVMADYLQESRDQPVRNRDEENVRLTDNNTYGNNKAR